MMSGERQVLDFGELDDFAPRPKLAVPPTTEREAVYQAASFPSREPDDDGQINIKGPEATFERFRQLAKKERYRHAAFLAILMDAYEGRGGGDTGQT
jgi:hypothetical protein